jgi:septum formation protein
MSRFYTTTGSGIKMGFSSSEFSSKFSVPDPVPDAELNKKRSPLVCGSGSASRKLILTAAGYDFEIVKADIDERALGDRAAIGGDIEKTKELVLQLAHAKADAILEMLPKKLPTLPGYGGASPSPYRVLLTADQVCVCNNQILEKPLNEKEARAFLAMYGSHPCTTVGSLVLTDISNIGSEEKDDEDKEKKRVSCTDTATIHFTEFSAEAVDALLAEGTVYHCAGGLMIESPLVLPFIKNVEGSEESVMGMNSPSLDKLFKQLEQ